MDLSSQTVDIYIYIIIYISLYIQPFFTGEGRLLTAPAAPFSAWALRFLEEVKDNDSFCISLSWAIEGNAALIVGADTGITGHGISTCDMITIWLFNIAMV